MYKITATIEKEGGTPTNWTRYSKSKLTKSECEKMLSGKKEAGVSREQKVKLINLIARNFSPRELHCIQIKTS